MPVDPPIKDEFLSPPQMRALKIAVVVMGVILVAGFAAIVVRIIYLTSNKPAIAAVPAGPATLALPLADVRLALPPGAEVKSVTLDGNRLAVHHSGGGPKDDTITIIDLATGRIISRVAIERKAP